MRDFEDLLERFYRYAIKQGDVCVDVGAHAGRHTMPLAAITGGTGHITAVEPLPHIADILRSRLNSAGIAHVSLFCGALGTDASRASFVMALDALEYSGLKERVYDTATRTEIIEVEVRSLDDLMLAYRDRVRYIKIDTEGGEWGVIQGAVLTIVQARPLISFEFGANSYSSYNVDPRTVHAFFLSRGFSVFDILGRRLDADTFAESSIRQELWDYLALPDEEAEGLSAVLRTNAAASD